MRSVVAHSYLMPPLTSSKLSDNKSGLVGQISFQFGYLMLDVVLDKCCSLLSTMFSYSSLKGFIIEFISGNMRQLFK